VETRSAAAADAREESGLPARIKKIEKCSEVTIQEFLNPLSFVY
jgi:hypothetical protein